MNYVIARLKEEYEKLFAGEELYQIPDDLENAVAYDPGRSLEEDEWYKLEEFSKETFCIDLLKESFRSTDYAEAKKVKTDDIEYICSYQEGTYFFQRIFKQNILKQKRITLGDVVALDKGEKSIVINTLPDAIYLKRKDILYFKNLQTIAPIFKGILSLYKEATRQETQNFLENDFIELGNGYGVDKVKTMNRKRIALAMDTLKEFNKKQRKKIFDYTHRYYPQLEYDDKQKIFKICSETDLKYLLWGIEERYYTSPVTNEDRVANSVSVMEKK